MPTKSRLIYLDNAATTPVDPKVLRAMLSCLEKNFGNPSSIHQFGQKAVGTLETAREKVADFLNCSPEEIIFTGSATEANNMAVRGIFKVAKRRISKPHIITSAIEHHAVLKPCEVLEQEGSEVTYLPVDEEGVVRVSDVKKALKKNTVLVSIMYANNEIGAIQPIVDIGKIIKEANKTQEKGLRTYFHTDAVQAANYLDCDVDKLGVDLLTISAHKIYGPKGVGALYIRKGTLLEPLIFGGGHELGMRSGTENVAGIVGFAAAIEEVKKNKQKIKETEKLRDIIIEKVLKTIPDSKLNGPRNNRLPNNASFSFPGAEGESMVMGLDQEGIAVSTGSACSSKDLKPSHVLLALGLDPKQAHGSLRVTLGRYTTKEDISRFLKVLPGIIKRIRKISPF